MDETRAHSRIQPAPTDVIGIKAEAINALVESFERRYEDGQFSQTSEIYTFLTTWRDAINDLLV
jgi:hypothetical protein